MMLVVTINGTSRRPRMVSIAKALGQVKEDFRNPLPEQSILDVCKQVGQTFRRRLLGPVKTVYLFLLQVLHGNLAISGLHHLTDIAFTDSGYCQSRGRLKVELLSGLFDVVPGTLRRAGESFGLWHGHRVIHIDATGVSMPDRPALQK